METDECPICLIKKPVVKICVNNHKTCKVCAIISCNSGIHTCSICRGEIIHNFTLCDLETPYNINTHKLQHRYSDDALWEDFYDIDSKNILSNINLSYALDSIGGSYILNDNFKVYWGDHVNESILGLHWHNVHHAANLLLSQKEELINWRLKYKDIIVQRNRNHTGMRLVRIVDN